MNLLAATYPPFQHTERGARTDVKAIMAILNPYVIGEARTLGFDLIMTFSWIWEEDGAIVLLR